MAVEEVSYAIASINKSFSLGSSKDQLVAIAVFVMISAVLVCH